MRRVRTRPAPVAAFRAAAHRWFAQAPKRLGLARLHGQMAALCRAERDAVTREYDWPPRGPLTPEERARVDHLAALGDEAAARMDRLAPGGVGHFYDFIFNVRPEDAP